jgi:hypothetical protein
MLPLKEKLEYPFYFYQHQHQPGEVLILNYIVDVTIKD